MMSNYFVVLLLLINILSISLSNKLGKFSYDNKFSNSLKAKQPFKLHQNYHIKKNNYNKEMQDEIINNALIKFDENFSEQNIKETDLCTRIQSFENILKNLIRSLSNILHALSINKIIPTNTNYETQNANGKGISKSALELLEFVKALIGINKDNSSSVPAEKYLSMIEDIKYKVIICERIYAVNRARIFK